MTAGNRQLTTGSWQLAPALPALCVLRVPPQPAPPRSLPSPRLLAPARIRSFRHLLAIRSTSAWLLQYNGSVNMRLQVRGGRDDCRDAGGVLPLNASPSFAPHHLFRTFPAPSLRLPCACLQAENSAMNTAPIPLPRAVHSALITCAPEIRRELCNNVLLTGGGSNVRAAAHDACDVCRALPAICTCRTQPALARSARWSPPTEPPSLLPRTPLQLHNIQERLKWELIAVIPAAFKPRVVAPSPIEREYASWIGGSILCECSTRYYAPSSALRCAALR